jgi:mRNA-degrading endonuclease RelE of RelBE toxin-antitoxin system
MSVEVHLSQRCSKYLSKLERSDKDRLLDKLRTLKENPYPSDSKFITQDEGDKVFRIRIGDLRAL